MADVKKSIDFVLWQEDQKMSGIITNVPGDLGGTTRFGLSQRYHPELVSSGFFGSLPTPQALTLAESTYAAQYATPLCIGEINDQCVANALLSFAVNEEGAGNRGNAVKNLQIAAKTTSDGVMGPGTVAAVNGCSGLLSVYCQEQTRYYQQIANNPSQEKFLAGWLNRVKAIAECQP